MKYVRENETYLVIPDNYEQTFVNSNFATINENSVILQKYNGNIDNEDMTLVKFIHDMIIVTKEQLERYCLIKNISDGVARAENLISHAVLNKFFLTDEARYKGELPSDIRMFYCLQDGGRILLEKYREMDLIDWTQSKNCMSSRGIGKTLINTEMYLDMLASKDKFFTYEKNPCFTITNSNTLRAGACYGLRTQNGNVYVLTDIIKKSEDVALVKDRLRKYESLILTRRWKRYYHDGIKRPVLCIIVDSDNLALALSNEIKDSTLLSEYVYFTTPKRMIRGIRNNGAILRYNLEEGALYETDFTEVINKPEKDKANSED